MAGEKDIDLVQAMISSSRAKRRRGETVADALAENSGEKRQPEQNVPSAPRESSPPRDERIEVRPIGTSQGLKELAALHKKTWSMLNVQEKRVHMMLWPLALHFGLYSVGSGGNPLQPVKGQKRPPLIGAFWARCLAESPLTLGHLYPPSLFRGISAEDIWEFGGMVIDPNYQGKGLVRMLTETSKLFLFARRPKLLITNPVEPLYAMYKAWGMKTVGTKPVEHPHAFNVKVWLMYGDFDELAKPYFM